MSETKHTPGPWLVMVNPAPPSTKREIVMSEPTPAFAAAERLRESLDKNDRVCKSYPGVQTQSCGVMVADLREVLHEFDLNLDALVSTEFEWRQFQKVAEARATTIELLKAENERLKKMILAQAERIAQQSDLLSRKAETTEGGVAS